MAVIVTDLNGLVPDTEWNPQWKLTTQSSLSGAPRTTRRSNSPALAAGQRLSPRPVPVPRSWTAASTTTRRQPKKIVLKKGG